MSKWADINRGIISERKRVNMYSSIVFYIKDGIDQMEFYGIISDDHSFKIESGSVNLKSTEYTT